MVLKQLQLIMPLLSLVTSIRSQSSHLVRLSRSDATKACLDHSDFNYFAKQVAKCFLTGHSASRFNPVCSDLKTIAVQGSQCRELSVERMGVLCTVRALLAQLSQPLSQPHSTFSES